MGLSSRTSRFFGNPSPGKTFGDVARQLNYIIKENTKRTSDVVLAAYSIGCDGTPTVTLLDGSPCDTGQDRIGLATRDRALLDGTLPQSLRSNNAGTGGVVATTAVDGGAAAGRFFVDTAKALYEGRNGLYHAGRYPRPTPNGTAIGETAAYDEIDWFTGDDTCTPFNSHYDDEFSKQHEIKEWIDSTSRWTGTGDYLPSAEVFGPDHASYGDPYYSPDFCMYLDLSSLEPFGYVYTGDPFTYDVTSDAYLTATMPSPGEEAYLEAGEQLLDGCIFLGRCSTSGGGRRDSSTYRVSVEAYSETDNPYPYPVGYASLSEAEQQAMMPGIIAGANFHTCLVFRDATTYAVLGRRRLVEAEEYARSQHPDRCQVSSYGIYAWRAGIVVRPAADGTCVVSILDSDRAWVFDHVSVSSQTSAIEPRLLETVTFPTAYSGAIRVLYR